MASRTVQTDLDLGGVGRLVNLPDPTDAQHAATKAYVDSAITGLNWKDSVLVATQANINLSSPGATIDGITPTSGVSRVLVKDQTTGSQNGIYIWNGAATPMTRATDADTAAELEQAIVLVEEGTSAGVGYRQTAINFTLDSGAVAWTAAFSGAGAASTSSAGVVELATDAETNTGTDTTRAITPSNLSQYTGFARKYATDFGDGSATSYTITHNLNTRDVVVMVRLAGSAYDVVDCEIEVATVNTVTIKTNTAPASNAYRAIVVG